MPETLQVTQTPTPAPVDTPNIITNLNTDTGPQAAPQAFGPDLNGLAQGLDSANQDIQTTVYRTRFERQESQEAKTKLWALSQHTDLAKQWTANLAKAEANGTPIDPDKFNSDYQSQVDSIAAKAPNEMGKAMFMSMASGLGLDFYKQNLASIVRVRQQDRQLQAQNVIGGYVDAARNGSLSPQDAIAGITSVAQTVAPAVDGISGLVSQAQGQVVQAGITNLAKSHGPGIAALAVRGGFGGQSIDPTHRELLATQLDNQQDINIEARKSVAQQNVNGLANKAAAGGFVSTQDAHSAATELASATQAVPVDTKTPYLVDFVRGRVDEINNLSSQISESDPFAKMEVEGIARIKSQDISKVVEQRLNLMPADEQRLGVQQMADAFGPEDPIVQHAARIAGDNIEMLTPGSPKYDPASIAMKNPAVLGGLSAAQDALQSATNPTDQGKAQGLVKTALEQSFAAQRLVGVPAGQEQVLTRQQAEAYGGAADDPAQAKKLVNQMQSLYGPDYSTRAIQQIFTQKGKVNGAVQLALLNPNSEKVWASAQFQPDHIDPKDPVLQTINSAMNSNDSWLNYWSSQKDDLGAAQRRSEIEKALPNMAQYYMKQFNMQPGAAVNAVVSDTIGAGYTTVPVDNGNHLSLPKKLAPTTQDATNITDKAGMAAEALITKYGIASATGIQDQGHLWTQAMTDGYWSYDAKSGSVVRMRDDGRGPAVVTLGNGQPLQLDAQLVNAADTVTRGHGHAARMGLSVDPDVLLSKPQPVPDNSPVLSQPAPKDDPTSFMNYIKTHPAESSLEDKLPASMKKLGGVFEKYGQQYGVDPALLAAISMHETGLGTSRAYLRGNNAMGISNSSGPISFNSVDDSIEHQAQTLAMSPLYSNWRKSQDIDELASVYAPVGAENDPRNLNKDWASGVSKFYSQLKD